MHVSEYQSAWRTQTQGKGYARKNRSRPFHWMELDCSFATPVWDEAGLGAELGVVEAACLHTDNLTN